MKSICCRLTYGFGSDNINSTEEKCGAPRWVYSAEN
jgi:hypothetical protein